MTKYAKLLRDYQTVLKEIDDQLQSGQVDEELWFAARCGLLDGTIQALLEKLAEEEQDANEFEGQLPN